MRSDGALARMTGGDVARGRRSAGRVPGTDVSFEHRAPFLRRMSADV